MKNFYLIVILLNICISCSKKSTLEEIEIPKDLKKVHSNIDYEKAKFKINDGNYSKLGRIRFITSNDKNLYWINHRREELISYINPDKPQDIYDAGVKKGRGPKKYGNLTSLNCFKNQIYFYDVINKKIGIGKTDTFKKLRRLDNIEQFIHSINIVNDTSILISGIFDKMRFGILDEQNELDIIYKGFPYDGSELSTASKNMGFTNEMTSHKNKIANIVYNSGIIEFFKLRNNKLKKYSENLYSQNNFKIKKEKGAKRAIHSKDNTGFIDITSNENFVFTLYSSISYNESREKDSLGRWILCYTWKGELVKLLYLTHPINRFALYKNKLISFFIDREEEKVKLINYYFDEK